MKDRRVRINVSELEAEVRAMFETAKSEERPEHRIKMIVNKMREYKRAVAKANVPRGYLPDAGDRLRAHREGSRAPDADLVSSRTWLTDRDSAYVLGPQVHTRLDDADWERRVWSPLHAWVERGYALLFGGAETKDWPHPVPPNTMQAWEAEELELEYQLFARIGLFVLAGDELVIDATEPFTIRWRDLPCSLGDTDAYRIMEELVGSKGRKTSREAIALAIGNDDYSDEALRQAVSRLRAKLRTDGLGELARRIKTSDSGRYVHLAPPSAGDASE